MQDLTFESFQQYQAADESVLDCDCGSGEWTLLWSGNLECASCGKIAQDAKWYRLCEIE